MDDGPKISSVEWGLVIAVLFIIDGTQILLEWLVIGFFLNPFIDLFVGMSFALYLQLRGQSMANPKRLAALVGTMGLEMIPVVAELPLWGLDGIFNMVISKSDKIISKIPGGGIVEQGRELAGGDLRQKLAQEREGARRFFEGQKRESLQEIVEKGTSQIREVRDQIQKQGDSDEW